MRFRMDSIIMGFILVGLIFASEARSHGPHHSPIKPAYDCYRNPDGPDTQGDVVLTHDLDLKVWVVWKCQCEFLDWIGWHCWWRHKGQYAKKERAIKRMRELTGPKHRGEFLRRIRVSWWALHDGKKCYIHYGRRYAVVVRRAG